MRDVEMRDILIYMDTIYEHNWDKVYNAIQCKVKYPESEVIKVVDEQLEEYHIITIIDNDYPASFKRVYKPPFIVRVERAK